MQKLLKITANQSLNAVKAPKNWSVEGLNANFKMHNKDPSFVQYEEKLYNQEQLAYIQKIKEMKYSELLKELKKIVKKPENRQRKTVLQHIVDNLPTQQQEQEQLQQQQNEDLNGISQQQQKNSQQKEYLSDNYDYSTHDHDLLSDPQNIEVEFGGKTPEILNSSRFSSYNSVIIDHVGSKPTNSIYFLENYSQKQLEQEIRQNLNKPYQLKKELQLFLYRSDYISEHEKQFRGKIDKTYGMQELKQLLADLVSLEIEFCRNYRDYQRKLDKEISENKLVNTTIHQLTSQLADSVNFWNYASFLRFNQQSTLGQFWKSITMLSEFYDLQNLEILFRAIMLMKKNSKIVNQDEQQFFEQLSGLVLEQVSEIQPSQTGMLQTIANILAYFKAIDNYNPNNFSYSSQTITNLKKIGNLYIQMFQNIFISSEDQIEGSEFNFLGQNAYDKQQPVMPAQTIRYLTALNYVDVIPRIVVVQIFNQLVRQGMKNFEKSVLIQILSQCMLQNILITEEMAQQIRSSKKIIMDLSIREIYIIIHSFQAANLDIGQIYNNLYFATGLRIENMSPIIDFKTIMMIAKIHHYILTVKMHDHRRNYIDRRSQFVLSHISNSLNDQIISQNVNDVVYISSLFLPFLNIPDFLFKEILKHRFEMKINTESRSIYSNFILKLLDKLNQSYTIFGFINSHEIEMNNKFTKDVKQLLQYLILKFRESKLLSYFLLTIHIGAHEQVLFSKIFPRIEERKHIIETSSKQILNLLRGESSKLGYNNIVLFAKFIYQNQSIINKRVKHSICDYLIQILLNTQNSSINNKNVQKKTFSQNLEFVYYLTHIIVLNQQQQLQQQPKQDNKNSNISKNVDTQQQQYSNNNNQFILGINPNQEQESQNQQQQQFSPATSEPKISHLNKLKEYVQNNLEEFLNDKIQYCQPHVLYEDSIYQRFNLNTYNASLDNVKFIFPILFYLKVDFFEEKIRENKKLHNLKQIIERTCKLWDGPILVQNLMVLNAFADSYNNKQAQIQNQNTSDVEEKLDFFKIFELVSENLFTCFIYFYQNQQMTINQEIFQDAQIIKNLLVAYANQFSIFLKKENSGLENINKIKFLAIPMLLNESFELLNFREMVILIHLVGNQEKFYPEEFVKKFNLKEDFEKEIEDEDELIEIWNQIPPFLENPFLKEKVQKIIYQKKENQGISKDLLITLTKERILNPKIVDKISQNNGEIIKNNTLLQNSVRDYVSTLVVPINQELQYPALTEILNPTNHVERLKESIIIMVQQLIQKYQKDAEEGKDTFIDDILCFQNKNSSNQPENSYQGQKSEFKLAYFVEEQINYFIQSAYFHNYQQTLTIGNQSNLKISYFDSFAIQKPIYEPNFKISIQENFNVYNNILNNSNNLGQSANFGQPQQPYQPDNSSSNNNESINAQQNSQKTPELYDHLQQIIHNNNNNKNNQNNQYSQIKQSNQNFQQIVGIGGGAYNPKKPNYELFFKYFVYMQYCPRDQLLQSQNNYKNSQINNSQNEENNSNNNKKNNNNSNSLKDFPQELNYQEQSYRRILEEFQAAQHILYNELKTTEEYSDFLIDVTLALQNQNYFYKTNTPCENTQIMLDIVIPEKKIAFIYLDDTGVQRKNNYAGPNSYALLKCHILKEYGGWQVTPVYYNQWAQKYRTKLEREEFINKCFQQGEQKQQEKQQLL